MGESQLQILDSSSSSPSSHFIIGLEVRAVPWVTWLLVIGTHQTHQCEYLDFKKKKQNTWMPAELAVPGMGLSSVSCQKAPREFQRHV